MDQLTERLLECFRSVFEDLSDEQLQAAVRTELEEWDSLASLTLLTVFEEEFDVEFDDDTVAGMNSFAEIRAAIERNLA